VATASASTTEAACEYLNEKLAGDDAVYVLTVDVPDKRDDRQAALDTAQVALADGGEVRTIRRTGDPGEEIVAVVRHNVVDESIVGPAREGGISSIGSTTRTVLRNVDEPVLGLPAERP
jgi:nucleotide-binding universal stress UspA family protein